MDDAGTVFGIVWALTQMLSIGLLSLGARWVDHPRLRRLGAVAYRRKLRALETLWPLTRLRPAVLRKDAVAATMILSSLIILKSAACFVFGIAVVFWLPVAGIVTPALVAIHDPEDPALGVWARKVATLQVTSHAIAAALGFALVVTGPLRGTPILATLSGNAPLVVIVLSVSLLLALLAGRVEAAGVMHRGL